MTIRNYQDLVAWQKAMDLVEQVYVITATFPSHEQYGLTSQLRRAAVSIPSNIAEGEGRSTRPEFKHFLSISHGSLREVETQLMIAQRLRYVDESAVQPCLDLAIEIGKILRGLMKSLSD